MDLIRILYEYSEDLLCLCIVNIQFPYSFLNSPSACKTYYRTKLSANTHDGGAKTSKQLYLRVLCIICQ